MPLLVCPNDNESMQSVIRSGVEFDFCPACRGVWLDRGELEKLMSAARDDHGAPGDSSPRGAPYPPQPSGYARTEQHRGYDRDRRWEDDDYRRRKRSGFDILDIFG